MLNNRLVLIIGLLVPIIVIGGITLYNVLSNDNVVDTPPDVTDTPTNDGLVWICIRGQNVVSYALAG